MLSGIGFYLLAKYRKWSVLIPIFIWLASFALYYFTILKSDIQGDYLQTYFENTFLDLSFTKESWAQNGNILLKMLQATLDKTTVSVVFGILVFGLGCWTVITERKEWTFLLLTPILTILLATAFRYYNLIPRTTLFLQPFIWLMMAFGIDYVVKHLPRWGQYILLTLILLGLFNKKGHEFLYQKMTFEEIKPCLIHLNENGQDHDHLYVHHKAVPAYRYYAHWNRYKCCNVYLGQWDTQLAKFYENTEGNIWMLFSHTSEQEAADIIESGDILPERIDDCLSRNVSLYGYTYR